jgi:hypothetical protein
MTACFFSQHTRSRSIIYHRGVKSEKQKQPKPHLDFHYHAAVAVAVAAAEMLAFRLRQSQEYKEFSVSMTLRNLFGTLSYTLARYCCSLTLVCQLFLRSFLVSLIVVSRERMKIPWRKILTLRAAAWC